MTKETVNEMIGSLGMATMLSKGIIEGNDAVLNSRPVHSLIVSDKAYPNWYELGKFGQNKYDISGSRRPVREDFNSLLSLGYNNLLRTICGMEDGYNGDLTDFGMTYPAHAEIFDAETESVWIAPSTMSDFSTGDVFTKANHVWMKKPVKDEIASVSETKDMDSSIASAYRIIEYKTNAEPFCNYDAVSSDKISDEESLKSNKLSYTGTYRIADFTMARDFYGWILPGLVDFSFSPTYYFIDSVDRKKRSYRKAFICGSTWIMTSDSGLNLMLASTSRSLYYTTRINFEYEWMTNRISTPPLMPFYYRKGETYHITVSLNKSCLLSPPGSNLLGVKNKTKFSGNDAWNGIYEYAMYEPKSEHAYRVPSTTSLKCTELNMQIPEVGMIS